MPIIVPTAANKDGSCIFPILGIPTGISPRDNDDSPVRIKHDVLALKVVVREDRRVKAKFHTVTGEALGDARLAP